MRSFCTQCGQTIREVKLGHKQEPICEECKGRDKKSGWLDHLIGLLFLLGGLIIVGGCYSTYIALKIGGFFNGLDLPFNWDLVHKVLTLLSSSGITTIAMGLGFITASCILIFFRHIAERMDFLIRSTAQNESSLVIEHLTAIEKNSGDSKKLLEKILESTHSR